MCYFCILDKSRTQKVQEFVVRSRVRNLSAKERKIIVVQQIQQSVGSPVESLESEEALQNENFLVDL